MQGCALDIMEPLENYMADFRYSIISLHIKFRLLEAVVAPNNTHK